MSERLPSGPEKLELLAQRFDHKVAMRESWLNENQRLVSQVWGKGLGSGGKGRKGGADSPDQKGRLLDFLSNREVLD